jgi:hypothetical protein
LRPGAAGDDAADAIGRAVVPLDRLPLDLAPIVLGDAHDVSRFRSGCALDAGPDPGPPGSRAVRDPSGSLLGVGRVEGRTLRPSVVLSDAGA